MTYTDEQLRDFARKVIEVDVQDPDFMGVGEQFEDEWADLTQEEFDEVRSKVHSLACSAIVTVTFPGEPSERDRRSERARAVEALGDVGRTAEAASGDLEDGINAELLAARAERDRLAEQVQRVRDVHRPVSAHVGDPDDDDTLTTACVHCEVLYPCDTIRALDKTGAGS
jgi:hypothetical protein